MVKDKNSENNCTQIHEVIINQGSLKERQDGRKNNKRLHANLEYFIIRGTIWKSYQNEYVNWMPRQPRDLCVNN